MIPEDPIDLWQIPLSLPEKTVTRLGECLNAEEHARIARFHFPRDRDRYTVSRGALRFILARYLDDVPGNIEFGFGEHGKPFLSRPAANHGLEFNLSHCADLTIVAAASHRRLGVDLETVRAIPEMDQIATTHFTEEERSFIESVTGQQRIVRFLRIWTRREAAAKALGLDLSAALTRVDVPVYPGGGSACHEGNGRWFMADLRLDPAHIGALCAEEGPREIAYHDFLSSFPV